KKTAKDGRVRPALTFYRITSPPDKSKFQNCGWARGIVTVRGERNRCIE
ncbi:hypothetical protein GE061_012906, partial [Apolygus lucorum]